MKKITQLRALLVMLMMCVGMSAWAVDVKGTITFGSSNVQISGASVNGNDDQGNSWSIKTVGTTSFTQNAAYSQVGSSSKPATSITFTTTLSESVTIKSMSAKFGGFSGTAGTVTLKVGSTTVGTGSLNATNDVTVNSTKAETGTVLTVTVTDIAKGVKCYNISYTIDGGSSDPVDATWNIESSVSMKEGRTKTLALTTDYDGDLVAVSENEAIATASYDEDNKILSVTGVSVGSTRIAFMGDATDSYNAVEKYVNVIVLAPGVVSAGEFPIDLNNELFGTNYTSSKTSCSYNELNLLGEENGISINVKNNDATNMYITDETVRLYNHYTMEVSVPVGYVITDVSFNEPTSNKKWDANPTPSTGEFTENTKNWTGNAQNISFTFTAQCRIVSLNVTVAVAPTPAPTFASLDELIDANLEEETVVNVTIEDIVYGGMGNNGNYMVMLQNSEVTLVAPGAGYGTIQGGTVSGTLENVTWDPYNYVLSSEDGETFWASLEYTPAGATETITINPACNDGNFFYTTYSSMNAFYAPLDDLIIYEVMADNGEIALEPYEPGSLVPAYTGVLVCAMEGGDYEVNIETDEATADAAESLLGDDNALRPTCTYGGVTAEDMEWDNPDCKFYRLTMHKGKTIGFWWGAEDGAGFELGNNKAYLAMPNSSPVKAQGLWFNNGETAIKNIETKAVSNKIFNLQGQRVNAAQKGIYIVNGKKVVK